MIRNSVVSTLRKEDGVSARLGNLEEFNQVYFSCGRPNFLGGSDVKECTCNAGDLGSIPGLGRSSREGHGNPFQYSCLENPHGQRSLVGYSPWGRRESDRAEQLSTTHSTAQAWLQGEKNLWLKCTWSFNYFMESNTLITEVSLILWLQVTRRFYPIFGWLRQSGPP